MFTQERVLNRLILLVGSLTHVLGEELRSGGEAWRQVRTRILDLTREADTELAATMAAIAETTT